MRANPMVRAITAATVLTLATSSLAVAQTDQASQTQFAKPYGPTLVTALVRNAVDDADTNALIQGTARRYHATLGGKTGAPAKAKKNAKKEPARGGWISPDPFEGSEAVTQAAFDIGGEQAPDMLIISGGDWKANVGIAQLNPSTKVIDLNQPEPCLTASGLPDLSAECAGNEGNLPSNYLAMEFAVEEGAYLAGVVAARESRGEPLGIISGSPECLECDRYVTGFVTGARSVEPDIDIELAYLADDEVAGFRDEASAKTYAEAFIDVYQPGILLPVGRGATMGMVEAACDAGVKVIGTGIDISAERPDLRLQCVLASIVPDVAGAVEEAMYYFSVGGSPSAITYDLARGGVTVTDEWRLSPTKRVDTNEFYDAAELAVITQQVEPCPGGCGLVIDEPASESSAG